MQTVNQSVTLRATKTRIDFFKPLVGAERTAVLDPPVVASYRDVDQRAFDDVGASLTAVDEPGET